MGTAFNTTTVALIAATTMMFCLFLSERVEKEIVRGIDRRTERELLNRFEIADASLTPFLNALRGQRRQFAGHGIDDRSADGNLVQGARSLAIASRQTPAVASPALGRRLKTVQQRFETHDAQRERQLVQMLETMEMNQKEHRKEVQTTVDQVATLKVDFARLVEALSGISQGESELIKLQASLADNLRLLAETQQIDEALHGLTAAIHLITARVQPTGMLKERRVANTATAVLAVEFGPILAILAMRLQPL